MCVETNHGSFIYFFLLTIIAFFSPGTLSGQKSIRRETNLVNTSVAHGTSRHSALSQVLWNACFFSAFFDHGFCGA